MNGKDRQILEKIVRYCDDISILIERFGDEFSIYARDFAYQYACNMCIMQIGELTARLSDEMKLQYPDVPWRIIKAMRNLFAHDYERVDNEMVWSTLKENIPELKESCLRILESNILSQ